MHDGVRDGTDLVLCAPLKTAGIIGKSSRVDAEFRHAVRGLLGLRPLDSYSLERTNVSPIP